MKKSIKESVIELRNLSIGYRSRGRAERYVCRDINASLYSGELTAIMGANGIGKSTLIRTITKAQSALCGEVRILGRRLDDYTPNELATLVSVVLTEKPEIKSMRVFDLVGMGRAPYTGFWGDLSQEDIDIVEDSLSQVRISALRDRMVDTLSDGERQKVMIAKALSQQTPIILLDEPTAFLDFPSKVETMQLLHHLARSLSKTILLSTHDLDLALQIADKIWIMDGTSNMRMGSPEDLALDGTLNSIFQSKGVLFDRERGIFRVDYRVNRQARVEGAGERYAMVCKALLRCGISEDGSCEEIVIRVDDDGIDVRVDGGQVQRVEKIEQLLDVILF